VPTTPLLSTIAGRTRRSAAHPEAPAVLILAALLALAAASAPLPAAAQTVGGALPQPLPLYPRDNWWNVDISTAPIDPS